ncbi:hypothetical protein O6H91_12G089000 [Diphasiastrum complanatum]|uniref:Uncharacterized protein n=2 Tax=Diphasiastrum complanatum TaxID=34168 RepID=A0ACC2C4Z6_DIPCM|nr:hypothetical protein O6H91_12G088400 [Diphasiastrum complanatum]KAJ7536934.1 hypothetical protein O6H91_12G089000 [Diphasiastrum complanatum]
MQARESEETGGAVEEDPNPGTVTGLPWWNGSGGGQPLEGNENPAEAPVYVQAPVDCKSVELVRQQGVLSQVQGMEQPADSSMATTEPPNGMPTLPAPCGFNESGIDEHHQQGYPTYVPPPGEYVPPHVQLDPGNPMIPTLYPYSDPYFGSILAAYGAQAMIHPHILGLQQARMPLPSEMVEEEPVYVNAKQYHGILRRRQLRAKAESENKLVKTRKPYLHESRHQHALRRARGCGGRFLNSKEKEESSKDLAGNSQLFEGPSSEAGSGIETKSSQAGQGNLTSSVVMQDSGRLPQVVKSAAQTLDKLSQFMMAPHGVQDQSQSMAYYTLPEGYNGGESAEAGELGSALW